MKRYLLLLAFIIATITITSTAQALRSTAQDKAQPAPQNWENLGVVTLHSNQRTYYSHGEEHVTYDTERAFLYAAFDGEKMIYKVFVPAHNTSYPVYSSGSYSGERVRWDRRGKRITDLPSLSNQYPCYCTAGYFDPASARRQ